MKTLIFKNPFDKKWERTFRSLVVFNDEEMVKKETLKSLHLKVADAYITPMWQPLPLKHPSGNIWMAYCDVRLSLPANSQMDIELIPESEIEDHTKIKKQEFGYDLAFLAGFNKTQIFVAFVPEGMQRTDPGIIVENLLDPKNFDKSWVIRHGGTDNLVSSAYLTNNARFRLWATYGSEERGMRFKIMPVNDHPTAPPGQIRGEFLVGIVGGQANFKFKTGYGIKPEFLGEDASIWKLPIDNLCDTQGWLCAGTIGYGFPYEVEQDSLYTPLGFMSREDYLKVKLPEVDLPQDTDQAFRDRLKMDAQSIYNDRQDTEHPPWWHMGGSYRPPDSGDQPQFGWYPYLVRGMIENADLNAFEALEAQEMRVMSARPGFIKGLYFSDGNVPDSTYYWVDYPHWTSRNRWGRDREGFKSGIDSNGALNGWWGQDAEHYGMTPAFWAALISGDFAMTEIFLERATMARCYAHNDYYFGAWLDVIRTEGRWGRVMWQAACLDGETEYLSHLKQRYERVIHEWNTKTFNGIPAPYASWSIRFRPDANLPGDPPLYVVWQSGTMGIPAMRLYQQTGSPEALEIAKDMVLKLVFEGVALQGEHPEAPFMKKLYDATNPENFKAKGMSMDGLTRWPMALIKSTAKELSDKFSAVDLQRISEVEQLFDDQWPDLDENKWGSGIRS